MLSCCVLLGSFSTTSGLLSAALWIMTDGCVRNKSKLITTIKYGDIIHLHHTAFGEGLCPSFEEILIPFNQGCFVQRLVEIGPGAPKKLKM